MNAIQINSCRPVTLLAGWGASMLPLAASVALLGLCACQKKEPQPVAPQASEPAATASRVESQRTAVDPPPGASASVHPDQWPAAAPSSAPSSAPTAVTSAPEPTPAATSAEPTDPPTNQGALANQGALVNQGALANLALANREGSKITGCLAQAPAKQQATRALPSRTPPAESWRVSALGNGALVTHTFDHACCLEGQATATVNGATIIIEERLTGQPCRCVCNSTIQTRVSAPPGEYDVQTFTITNGSKQLAHSGHVKVGLSPRP